MLIKQLKLLLPWWAKIPLKIILSRLPIDYQKWSGIGLFRHGNPNDMLQYFDKFTKHFNLAFLEHKPVDFVCLEVGPGDSIATGIIAHSFGASKTYLIDVGDFAIKDIDYYKRFIEILKEKYVNTLDIANINSFDELLKKFNIIYMKDGLASLKKLPDESLDFIFSHSAIEHIKLSELPVIINETRRLIRKTGKISHNIDLMDHLEYSLNSLRFSEKTWEGKLFSNSGFYTNRLRYSQIIKLFENSGFNITYKDHGAWKEIPIKKIHLHKSFKNLNEEDLLIRTMHIVGKVKLH